jgi:PKD repeat protein
MKNLTLLKIASLFIFLLSAQSSFGQLNCSDYPDWYQTTWYNSDVVHYNGKLYSPCYSSTVANLTIASNRTETTSPCFTFWGFVADCVNCSTVAGSTSSNATVCSGSNSGTITLSGHNGSIVRWEKSTNNWSTTTNISNTTTTQSYSNITSTTQYRAVVKDGSCSQLNSSATTITVNSAPTAAFSASATAVDTTQTITFTNNSTNATSYSWNFGDSTTSIATSPSHQYASAGTYTVTLTATNSCGNNTATTSITVYTAGTCSAVGTILMERYDGITGTAISDLTGSANYPQSPTSTTQRSSFEIPANVASNYGAKVSGYICAPQTGYYTFWMTSDDNGELNLSTDENPANKTTISYVTEWTPQNVWDDESNQKSNPVLLIAGNSYYVEALMKEAGGGDHLAVGWAKPGQSTNAPSQIIPGSVLSPMVYCPSASFTASGTTVEISQAVNFTNTTTGTSPTYSWDFGDGNTSTAASPTHQYASAGTYTVTLTATNSCGSDTATTSITVTNQIEDLFFEDFEDESDNDITGTDANGIPWSATLNGHSASYFGVDTQSSNKLFRVDDLSNSRSGIKWESNPINISGYESLELSSYLWFDGTDSYDYLRVKVEVDGVTTTVASFEDDVNNQDGDKTWTLLDSGGNPITGNSLKIIIEFFHDSDEEYRVDNIKLTGILYLPGCATNLSPTDTATNVSVTPTLSWSAVSGATGYKVYYGLDSTTTTALAETASTSVTLPTLQNGTQYYWKVVPTNARGDATGCGNAISFTTIVAAPGCATGLTPTNGTTDVSLAPTLSWTQASSATSYKVYLDTGSNPTTLIYTGSNTSIAAPTLQNGTQYYWKVVATNASGDATGCGNAISFTTIVAAPSCATGLTPTNGTTDVSLAPTLSWTAANGATSYKVYFDDSNATTLIYTGSNTSIAAPTLQNGTQYYWKVVPINAGGSANGCTPISFTTIQNPAGSVFITGNTVTVSKNAYLYLEKDFTNTGGSVTLNSDSNEFASMIVAGTATGNITYNKYVNYVGSDEWDLVGSPVVNQSISGFVTTNDDPLAVDTTSNPTYYALGTHDAATNNFTNYTGATVGSAGNFIPAKGYQMATDYGATMAFTGEVATTTQSVTIQKQAVMWNLVANPFPSYIKGNIAADATHNFLKVNADAGIINGGDYLAAYGWKADGSGYVAYNYGTGSTGLGSELLIAPGQGFFVAANSTSPQALIFTPQMRTTAGGDDFINGAPILLYYNFDLKLFHGNSEKAETKYFFQEGLTLGLDPGYDAGAFDQLTPLSSRLPEADTGVNFQINAMSLESAYNQSVPLVINQQEGQSFRISISKNTLPEDINVYLEDVLNGTLTPLKEQDFELSAQDNLSDDGRFYLHFTTQSLAIDEVLNPNNINVYKLNTEAYITINGLAPEIGKATATLYNMLGMKVRQKALNSSQDTQHISTQGLAGGVYIIKLNAGDVSFSKKVIIQ